MGKSDKFDPEKDYIGFVIYQYNGESSRTLNGVRCKAGYIYIQESSNLNGICGDTMHAKAFYKLFNKELDKKLVVASGFAFREGKWLQNSTTFNYNETPFTKEQRRDGVTEMELIEKAILNWSTNGCQNFSTKLVMQSNV